MDAEILQEINFGEKVCYRLKNIYYADIKWGPEVAREVTKLFGKLKMNAKHYYPDCNAIQLLIELIKYPDKALQETIDLC